MDLDSTLLREIYINFRAYAILQLTTYARTCIFPCVQVTSSISPIDKTLEEAAKERPGHPIRVRVQPSLLRHEEGRPTPHYGAWRNLHWMIQLADLAEARAFREALSAFFYAASTQGIGAVHEKLLTMIPNSPII